MNSPYLVAKHVLLLFRRIRRLVDGAVILMTTSFLLVDGVGVGFDFTQLRQLSQSPRRKKMSNYIHVTIGIPLKLDVHRKHNILGK